MPRDNTTDPRWVLAVAAARQLEGGRAGILTQEGRAHVLRIARLLGLRPFDAALVIAIVQDAARRGEPLGGEVSERLGMVRCDTQPRLAGLRAIATATVALTMLLLTGLLLLFLR
jgi:hypothetical protein